MYGDSGTAENTLCPQTAAAGGMDIADAVFPVVFEHFTVAAVNAGGEIKIIEFPAESPVICAVPDFGQGKFLHISEGVMINGSPDIA